MEYITTHPVDTRTNTKQPWYITLSTTGFLEFVRTMDIVQNLSSTECPVTWRFPIQWVLWCASTRNTKRRGFLLNAQRKITLYNGLRSRWMSRLVGFLLTRQIEGKKQRGSIHVLPPFGYLPCQLHRTVLSDDEWDGTRRKYLLSASCDSLQSYVGYTAVTYPCSHSYRPLWDSICCKLFASLNSPFVLRSTSLSSVIYYHSTRRVLLLLNIRFSQR
jgi:hypothetical protein